MADKPTPESEPMLPPDEPAEPEEAPYDGSVTYYEAKPQTPPEGLTSVPPVGANAPEGPTHSDEEPNEK